MPYKDPVKQRNNVEKAVVKHRKRRKKQNEPIIAKIRAIEGFNELPKKKQKILEKTVLSALSNLDAQIDALETSISQLVETKLDSIFASALKVVQESEELKQIIKQKEEKQC
ncbi:MAG: hypothetical protein NWF00_06690 [Candidatus Bathyarchaeota archaeon]|nr:hypothetical protein [Candidatus Bathyarchaeota archaeon]